MKIKIFDEAQDDLTEGFQFYESLGNGLGAYFLDCLSSDIDLLLEFSGIHPIVFGFHRLLSRRFPFAIYYEVEGDLIRVFAVLDCRRNPSWIRKQLKA